MLISFLPRTVQANQQLVVAFTVQLCEYQTSHPTLSKKENRHFPQKTIKLSPNKQNSPNYFKLFAIWSEFVSLSWVKKQKSEHSDQEKLQRILETSWFASETGGNILTFQQNTTWRTQLQPKTTGEDFLVALKQTHAFSPTILSSMLCYIFQNLPLN